MQKNNSMKLSELRELKGLTKKELAKLIDVSTTLISNWEKNKSEPKFVIMDISKKVRINKEEERMYKIKGTEEYLEVNSNTASLMESVDCEEEDGELVISQETADFWQGYEERHNEIMKEMEEIVVEYGDWVHEYIREYLTIDDLEQEYNAYQVIFEEIREKANIVI